MSVPFQTSIYSNINTFSAWRQRYSLTSHALALANLASLDAHFDFLFFLLPFLKGTRTVSCVTRHAWYLYHRALSVLKVLLAFTIQALTGRTERLRQEQLRKPSPFVLMLELNPGISLLLLINLSTQFIHLHLEHQIVPIWLHLLVLLHHSTHLLLQRCHFKHQVLSLHILLHQLPFVRIQGTLQSFIIQLHVSQLPLKVLDVLL